jgi:hypothetical protein
MRTSFLGLAGIGVVVLVGCGSLAADGTQSGNGALSGAGKTQNVFVNGTATYQCALNQQHPFVSTSENAIPTPAVQAEFIKHGSNDPLESYKDVFYAINLTLASNTAYAKHTAGSGSVDFANAAQAPLSSTVASGSAAYKFTSTPPSNEPNISTGANAANVDPPQLEQIAGVGAHRSFLRRRAHHVDSAGGR